MAPAAASPRAELCETCPVERRNYWTCALGVCLAACACSTTDQRATAKPTPPSVRDTCDAAPPERGQRGIAGVESWPSVVRVRGDIERTNGVITASPPSFTHLRWDSQVAWADKCSMASFDGYLSSIDQPGMDSYLKHGNVAVRRGAQEVEFHAFHSCKPGRDKSLRYEDEGKPLPGDNYRCEYEATFLVDGSVTDARLRIRDEPIWQQNRTPLRADAYRVVHPKDGTPSLLVRVDLLGKADIANREVRYDVWRPETNGVVRHESSEPIPPEMPGSCWRRIPLSPADAHSDLRLRVFSGLDSVTLAFSGQASTPAELDWMNALGLACYRRVDGGQVPHVQTTELEVGQMRWSASLAWRAEGWRLEDRRIVPILADSKFMQTPSAESPPHVTFPSGKSGPLVVDSVVFDRGTPHQAMALSGTPNSATGEGCKDRRVRLGSFPVGNVWGVVPWSSTTDRLEVRVDGQTVGRFLKPSKPPIIRAARWGLLNLPGTSSYMISASWDGPPGWFAKVWLDDDCIEQGPKGFCSRTRSYIEVPIATDPAALCWEELRGKSSNGVYVQTPFETLHLTW